MGQVKGPERKRASLLSLQWLSPSRCQVAPELLKRCPMAPVANLPGARTCCRLQSADRSQPSGAAAGAVGGQGLRAHTEELVALKTLRNLVKE